ncbi:spore coat putative kinase YutH [Bacillus fonticola]|uniref:spore coat putative kinase YutH n=1 Tax=Bacillus fonticola TaxID=2728853 RepID=UPI001473B580|nr:spore coat protein YutH [Bacillus fonticola]
MTIHGVLQEYGIEATQTFLYGRYQATSVGGVLYLIVPVTNMEQQELYEMHRMAEHIANQGDKSVARFLPAKQDQYVVKDGQEAYVVLYNNQMEYRTPSSIGRKLAKFHWRARTIPERVESLNRIGQWKTLWEQRLEQMEQVWQGMMMGGFETEFDRLFVESFPYYMALTDNAIQYVVDTEMDETPKDGDAGTACHLRFHEGTWTDQGYVKVPMDWVFDHAGRDLADWTRGQHETYGQTLAHHVQTFYRDYQSYGPLSPFSWRLIYGRLLFPLHYLECVEEFYLAPSEHDRHAQTERLQTILSKSRGYEGFLYDFFDLTEVPARKLKIPTLHWLQPWN